MARKTVLEKDGEGPVAVITDAHGTRVFDEDGNVLVTYGDDRHDEVVADYVRQGWVITEET